MDVVTFPIHPSDRDRLPLAPPSVPFWIVEKHQAQAFRNHGQSVRRLKERQGCSWHELLAILTDRREEDLPKMSVSAAMIEVVALVQKADRTWMDNWRSICAQRESSRLRTPMTTVPVPIPLPVPEEAIQG